MTIVLYRVDERLIHGQVVLGWGNRLRPDRYVIVDDELAASGWEQDLYRLAAGDCPVEFVGVDDARARLAEWREAGARTILLTRNLEVMLRLGEDGVLGGEEVNVGGQHDGPGRSQVLTYLYLTEGDRAVLRGLAEEGMRVSARDLPDAPRVSLAALLGP